MNRDFRVVARQFAIPLTEAEFEVLTHSEREHYIEDELLKIPGVFNVDYNGHFGSFLFLSVEKEHDNDNTLFKISDVINHDVSMVMYQIWGDDESWFLCPRDRVDSSRETGMIGMTAELQLEFPAVSWDSATEIYDIALNDAVDTVQQPYSMVDEVDYQDLHCGKD